MVQGISSFPNFMADDTDSKAFGTAAIALGEHRGMRTRVLLILGMSTIIIGITLVSLLAIRRPLQALFISSASSDLLNSVAIFENLQTQRMVALNRENSLLADLPSLKALMTTSDERTIEDGAVEFWRVGGNDLFALADRDRRIVAVDVANPDSARTLRIDLASFVKSISTGYLVSGNSIYGCSVRPLYFGSAAEGTVLGYVISGYAIDHQSMQQLGRATSVEATFTTGNRLLASSLSVEVGRQLATLSIPESRSWTDPHDVVFRGEHYLSVVRDLSLSASAPLKLVELRSLEREKQSLHEIDRLVLFAGVLALLLGSVLMVTLSRAVTRPLEDLAAGVRAFAEGDSAHILPFRGTSEVRELSAAFAAMRKEILHANQALLEAERLATIGRMASSVSHDLRHYLAAVYANSEFLALGNMSIDERSEILAEIRSAVNGTTELLESLLIFSRTGPGIVRSHQLLSSLVDRSIGLVRAHPDATPVEITIQACDPEGTDAIVDAKQIERGIYNLVLNACQAPRSDNVAPTVLVALHVGEKDLSVEVIDNGDGVPVGVRDTLFEPFVSEGKQKGSGLGLTLTQCIAAEHGGDLTLVRSGRGETIFRMSIARGHVASDTSTLAPSKRGTS
jgi:signal transduction histidine kinase